VRSLLGRVQPAPPYPTLRPSLRSLDTRLLLLQARGLLARVQQADQQQRDGRAAAVAAQHRAAAARRRRPPARQHLHLRARAGAGRERRPRPLWSLVSRVEEL